MAKTPREALVRWAGGVQIAGTRLWCDARRAGGVVFLSGADVVLGARLGKLLTTERTAQLTGGEALATPFARPFALGRARLELLPAGRMPGSAQLLVQLDGRALLYAGAVRPTPSRLAEPAQVRGCDVLVLAAAPSLLDARVVDEVRAALGRGESPVLRAPSMALAGELVALLQAAEIPVRGPAALVRQIAAYARLGVAVSPVGRATSVGRAAPSAFVWLAPARPPAGPVVEVAAAVDVPALVDYAVASGARDVYLVGDADRLAGELTARKLRVHRLGPPEQMRLGLHT